jgi:hypothetical protein
MRPEIRFTLPRQVNPRIAGLAIVTENLAMPLGSDLSQTFSSLVVLGHYQILAALMSTDVSSK